MASLFYNFAEGFATARFWGRLSGVVYDPKFEPVHNSTSGEFFLYVPYPQQRSGMTASDAAPERGKAVFEPDTTFTWPGGSYDKGEIPKGDVYTISLYDPEGNVVLQAMNVMMTVAQLAKAKTGTALEKLILSGDDNVQMYSGGGPVHGWAGDDVIDFFNERAVAYGGSGKDTISAKHYTEHGLSKLFGENGNDILNGSDSGGGAAGTGEDRLDGGSGNDRLFGFGGVDMLLGGAGDDTLTGGDGDDIVVFGTGDGVDTVTDFGSGDDTFDLSRWKAVRNYTDLKTNHASDQDGDVWITSGADKIIIENMTVAELVSDDFAF